LCFPRLEKAGLKVSAKKTFFADDQLEYLGYWITREGIQPSQAKVQAIRSLKPPTNKKELRRFIGMVNYCRDVWMRRSDTLAPLAALTSKTTKWMWTEHHQKAFDPMKHIVSRETLLAYSNFNLPFEIYTDASHTQLGAIISQQSRPIAFYSRKLSAAQTR
jgi:RNase H-like domain found in reverse transcriptase